MATVGDGQTKEEAEQGRLAGAVRSDQTMDLTLRHIQIYAIERDDVTETLGDPACPECLRLVHEPLLPKNPQDHRGGHAKQAGTVG
ncbi:hypothetical protein Sviol_49020 [Streptomyces violascens]|uniref:Uncharacterized protein n=1 Tax=Streptomyces violascens TaxID=67381 RepID=A0ABQ3QT80_9ACTN|nr:hypothetical protein Sviol_49020 [Streptomyces violascens]